MAAVFQAIMMSLVGAPPGSVNLAGAGTWRVPDGVFRINVTGCGGGGSGGSGDDGGDYNAADGGGGGGSNLISLSFNVVPGQTLNYAVGAGGRAMGTYNNGESGQPTTLSGTGVSFSAAGGGFGYSRYGSPPHLGGAGANGANNGRKGAYGAGNAPGGTSTNGGANGGYGGTYEQSGGPGQPGKLFISF